ncbi:MAG: hypothetical protein ACQCN3_08815 [Candidatus Bathyarchaeia archaeon]
MRNVLLLLVIVFAYLGKVTQPVNDYTPQTVNGTTYRYVWTITVDKQNYHIDAATGETVQIQSFGSVMFEK